MAQESMEIALIKYNRKTWCKSALLGFFIGLAVIVPGISGSTVAIIFKLYDQFLYAVGNLFKQFKKCFIFLLPIGVGIVLGLFRLLHVQNCSSCCPLPSSAVCGIDERAFPPSRTSLREQNERQTHCAVDFGRAHSIALGIGSVALNANAEAGKTY
ncbi:MAG: undecaprenyl phosphate translocase family protein [Christensenellaceae bacterium]